MFAIEGIDCNFRSELSPDNPQPVSSRCGPGKLTNPITMLRVRGAGQLRDFDIASCLIKADRTHNDGK